MPISHRHQPLVYPDYINPLPADDIIKIGAVKQDLYEKNYDKIQSHINELDKYGLELVRDVDKKYFSQEMNKYMKAINESVGKTDFANMANVRNILSTSRPLQNDSLILNSIKSTQELRNRQKTLASLKPGERNPANEWYYMNDVADWQNNPEVGATLSAGKEYVAFADPSEYIQSTIKNLKPKISTQIVKENGYLKTSEVEELTNQRLKEWMEANLPAQYKQQIMIDAMYTTKDVDPGEMSNYYFDTRLNQFNQIKKTLGQYEANKDYLTQEDVEEYRTLATRAKILENSLSNPPKTQEDAYNAWVNDHYNSYLTGQADLYAYRQEKKKMEADPFSLASYNSNLRKNEAYYREIALGKEKQRLGLQESGKIGPSGKTKKELEDQLAKAGAANESFKKFTNNLTNSSTYTPIMTNLLSKEDADTLKAVLKESLNMYSQQKGSAVDPANIPADLKLEDVQVRKNSDGTYAFRIDAGDAPGLFTGDVVYEVFQDKFDDAFRKTQGLEDVDYQYSVDSRFTRNEPVDESGETTESALRREVPKLDTGRLNTFYNSSLENVKKSLEQ